MGKKNNTKKKGEGNKKNDNDDDILDNIKLEETVASTAAAFPWKTILTVTIIAIIAYFAINSRNQIQQPNSNPVKSQSTTTTQKTENSKRLSISEVKQRTKTLPCKDRHDTNECAKMASQGLCSESIGWMTVMCGASCNVCELLDPKKRCSEENMGIKLVNAYEPGDMNKMFESLDKRYDIEILSKDPWMVLFKNFISEEESSTLLKLTEKNLKRSTDQGNIGDDGFQEQIVSQGRTSSNSWCMHGCDNHPVVANLTERIAEIVRVPSQNFEQFQVLRYEKTQKYDIHHDASQSDFAMPAGPRVLTFFMYLSDVEEGGATYFPRVNISVKPRKGWALLWPSVKNDFPNSEIEEKTYHAAQPVIKGTKYAANSWIHLRDYKTPNLWGCTGSFD